MGCGVWREKRYFILSGETCFIAKHENGELKVFKILDKKFCNSY